MCNKLPGRGVSEKIKYTAFPKCHWEGLFSVSAWTNYFVKQIRVKENPDFSMPVKLKRSNIKFPLYISISDLISEFSY